MSNSKLWQPNPLFIGKTNLYNYIQYINNKYKLQYNNYFDVHQWSVDNLELFWKSIADYFNIEFHQNYTSVLEQQNNDVFGASWFNGATLSYAEHIFRNYTDDVPAIIYQCENQKTITLSWSELKTQVIKVQAYLLENGIGVGDRVVGFLPYNIESIVAFLAVNSIGAIWSCCSPDFGTESVLNRFEQIAPKIFIAAQYYTYNDKVYDKIAEIEQIKSQLPSLVNTLIIGNAIVPNTTTWKSVIEKDVVTELKFTAVDFNHPIWILYSSGTTGKPKAITHSTGGNLLEHYKALALHQNVKKGDRFLWYSTTGWMMWNYALSSLLCGATLCIYDGSPAYPDLYNLWKFVANQKINHFGVGAAFHINSMKNNLDLSTYDFSALITIGSTGSPLPNEGFRWIYDAVKNDIVLVSISGGTDVCSAFVGGCPMLPVYEGEIQCKMLGAAIEAWNEDGKSVVDELGELMITQPMPSMPLYFWNDNNNEKYLSSYYENGKQVWQHGDWIKITKHNGIIIFGRSDATLNRDGVRIGTAEIYSAVESIDAIKDCLVICNEQADGSYFMPLFVVMNNDAALSEEIKLEIKQTLKNKYSPRHIPDAIFQVSDVPYTISGKKMEIAIKKIFNGTEKSKAASLDTMRNPLSLNDFVDWYNNQNT
ncbi:MAG: acetoacetate--CoA ligase [Chitinophagales bacterium]|nr:acetoacetate--CoA ligase [Chitinophagales bacterium]